MTIRPAVIASAEDVTFEVYCSVLDQMTGKEVAFDLKLPGALIRAFSDLKGWLTQISRDFSLNIADVARAFQQKDIFLLLKSLSFNVKLIWKAITTFTSLVPRGLIAAFQALERSGLLQQLRAGTAKVDDVLDKHPILKKLAGVALAGFLLWIWLSSAFTGDLDFDFDVATIIAAFKGQYNLNDLFLSPDGLAMLAMLGIGMFTGIGVAWLGSNVYNLVLAFVYTGARKAHLSAVSQHLTKALQPRKY